MTQFRIVARRTEVVTYIAEGYDGLTVEEILDPDAEFTMTMVEDNYDSTVEEEVILEAEVYD